MVKAEPLSSRIEDFAAFLAEPFDEDTAYLASRRAEAIGRPLGSKDWIAQLERAHRCVLASRTRGPRPTASKELEGDDLFSKLSA